ncbi:hypothetical protein KBC89_05355 [Candidatus Woesebacteria bacterium]|nr:hypothetical protein [Candidatus Woesebacteria bacterium]
MKLEPLHLASLAWRHRDKIPPILKKLNEALKDGREGSFRSLSKDLTFLSELFGTQIEFQGLEHIPKEGGVVLVTSHVVSTEAAPGWLNKDVNPFWWASGIAQGIKQVRDDEIRPIAYSSGKENSRHRKMVQVLYGGFPVSHDKKGKALNRAMTRAARKTAEKGGVVLIAPEGENRTGLTKPHLGGISRLLSRKVAFVPVAYFEVKTDSGFRYSVTFGQPIACDIELPEPETDSQSLPLTEDQRQAVESFVNGVMIKIAEMLPEERRGIYTNKVTK